MKNLLPLIPAMLLVVGCSTEFGSNAIGEPDGALSIEHDYSDMMVLGEFRAPPDSPYHPAHPEHQFAAGRAFSEAGTLSEPADKLMREGAPVGEIEPLAREAFAKAGNISEYARWALVADLGGKMLRAHLREEEPNMEAVAFYTQQLLNQDSPNAVVLAPALKQLEGTWTAEKITASRLKVANAVEPSNGGPAEMGDLNDANLNAAQEMRSAALKQ